MSKALVMSIVTRTVSNGEVFSRNLKACVRRGLSGLVVLSKVVMRRGERSMGL